MIQSRYFIRWDHLETYGEDFRDVCKDRYSYLSELKVAPHSRGCLFMYSLDLALEFGSWAEAAATAVFIIHHIDDMYEDALEVVKIDI